MVAQRLYSPLRAVAPEKPPYRGWSRTRLCRLAQESRAAILAASTLTRSLRTSTLIHSGRASRLAVSSPDRSMEPDAAVEVDPARFMRLRFASAPDRTAPASGPLRAMVALYSVSRTNKEIKKQKKKKRVKEKKKKKKKGKKKMSLQGTHLTSRPHMEGVLMALCWSPAAAADVAASRPGLRCVSCSHRTKSVGACCLRHCPCARCGRRACGVSWRVTRFMLGLMCVLWLLFPRAVLSTLNRADCGAMRPTLQRWHPKSLIGRLLRGRSVLAAGACRRLADLSWGLARRHRRRPDRRFCGVGLGLAFRSFDDRRRPAGRRDLVRIREKKTSLTALVYFSPVAFRPGRKVL